MERARQQLQQVPGLLHRMANLMGIEFHGELPSAEAEDLVLEEMWRFNQTYQLAHGVSRGSPGEPGPGPRGLHPENEQTPLPGPPHSLWLRHGPVTLPQASRRQGPGCLGAFELTGHDPLSDPWTWAP